MTKLRWAMRANRSKDIDDIRVLLSLNADTLDFDYIHAWCDKHGTRATLDEIRATVPII